jgi:hypothetical protein
MDQIQGIRKAAERKYLNTDSIKYHKMQDEARAFELKHDMDLFSWLADYKSVELEEE